MSRKNRDRRQARAKLRQLLAQYPAPIVYIGGDADLARRQAPPDVLPKMAFTECCCCQRAIVVHAEARRDAEELTARTDRELALVCGICADGIQPERFTMALAYHDAALDARLRQWQTEVN